MDRRRPRNVIRPATRGVDILVQVDGTTYTGNTLADREVETFLYNLEKTTGGDVDRFADRVEKYDLSLE